MADKSGGNRGGARQGAGRKSREYEIMVRDLAIQAIEEYYGSLKDGLKFLLQSKEPALVKFAWGHAIGNPKEFMEMDVNGVMETVQIIQLPDNGRDKDIDIETHLPSAN
tara:strand:- start:476 stop:802 length:327 start_codon:yes stop_codon:yes gene_type:complete